MLGVQHRQTVTVSGEVQGVQHRIQAFAGGVKGGVQDVQTGGIAACGLVGRDNPLFHRIFGSFKRRGVHAGGADVGRFDVFGFGVLP